MIRVHDLPQLAVDHRRLTDQIEEVLGAGGQVPCIGDPRWTSDYVDEQMEAAAGCLRCPVLEQCRAYFAMWPEPSGVWAGRTERDRDGRVGRRLPETAEPAGVGELLTNGVSQEVGRPTPVPAPGGAS